MKWFDGTITQAVQTSKAEKSVFIVYITGDDKVSTEVSKSVEDKQIELLQEENHCVAVRIQANSEDCSFFSQIYPVVVVPSIFFIGENGVPLEVIGGSISATDLRTKMADVIEIPKENSARFSLLNKGKIPPESVPGYKPPPTTAVTTTTTSTSSQDGASGSTVTEPTPKQSKEEIEKRLAKAEELIEKRREEKLKKDFEENRRKEEEKRQMGKDLQKLKQFQKEKEMQEVSDQMRKDKEADKQARIKVKEQIARDRAERAEKYNKEKRDREEKQSGAKKAKLMEDQKQAAEAEARRSETARIQFRLPDGSSVPHTFPSTDTLHTVQQFISQHINQSVTLSTTFPRRTFEDSDQSKSLIDLQLAPSSVVIVVPKRSTIVPRNPGGSSDIMSLLMVPVTFIINFLNYLRSFFGGSSSSQSPPSSSQSSSQATSASGGDRQTNQAHRRPTQDGNIRRFRNAQDDDDDENATWNGNSTQQM